MLQRVCQEMQQSEGVYLDSISTLLCRFLAPLLEQRLCDSLSMSSAAQQAWLRCHSATQPIVHLHTDLHRELRAIEVAHPPSVAALVCGIADVFLRYSSFLKLYNLFITSYLPCMEQVAPNSSGSSSSGSSSAASNRAFTRWQDEQKGSQQHNLQSLLIMPVQRVPRYELLLSSLNAEFLKDPAFDSAAHERLTLARSAIQAASKALNESKRDSEGQARLVTLHSHIRGLQPGYIILESHRRYVCDAPSVLQVHPRPSGAGKKLQLWLCNDVVVLLSAAPAWKVKGWIELTDITAVAAPQMTQQDAAAAAQYAGIIDAAHAAPHKCLCISSVENSCEAT